MSIFNFFKKKNKNEDLEEQKMYQQILDEIVPFVPKGFKRISIYFAISGNMTSPKFFVDSGRGWVDCFNLGIDKKDLTNLFLKINDILERERSKLSKDKQWSVFTMFVDSDGKFEVNYDYADISETYLEYEENWEKNNLK